MDKDQSTFDFNQCAILQLCCMTLVLKTTVINKHQPVSNYRNTENRKELKVQGKILKIKIIKGGQNLILKHDVFYCLAGCTDVTSTCKTVFCLQKCRKGKTSHIHALIACVAPLDEIKTKQYIKNVFAVKKICFLFTICLSHVGDDFF